MAKKKEPTTQRKQRKIVDRDDRVKIKAKPVEALGALLRTPPKRRPAR